MTLVDTSVWVDHFRKANATLQQLLGEDNVATHPFVIGELACGHLASRTRILTELQALPQAQTAEHDEVLEFVDKRRLWGKGLGWIDMHLLASAFLSGYSFLTLDKQLRRAADALHLIQ